MEVLKRLLVTCVGVLFGCVIGLMSSLHQSYPVDAYNFAVVATAGAAAAWSGYGLCVWFRQEEW